MKAIVLLSGGLDSTTCATLAYYKYGADEVKAISFMYGQTHSNELYAAEKVASYLGIDYERIVTGDNFFGGYGSSIIDSDKAGMPEASYEELQEMHGVSPTYVPYRNGTFLSVAAIRALQHDAEVIYFGAHSEDAHHWAYPDCTPEFIGAMANAIYIGSYHKVRLITPLQWMNKADVVALALKIGAPIGLTLSCYRGEDPACGTCPTCISRLHAFKVNDVRDPIDYRLPEVH